MPSPVYVLGAIAIILLIIFTEIVLARWEGKGEMAEKMIKVALTICGVTSVYIIAYGLSLMEWK